MKKLHKRLLVGALLASLSLSAAALAACDNPSSSTPEDPGITGTVDFELSRTSAEMVLGDELLLLAIYEKTDDKPLVWSSSNPAVVSVNEEGIVEAMDIGEATITATCGEKSASCKITVGLGDVAPTLTLKSYLGEDVVSFTTGVGYALNAVVSFNGKEFPCVPQVRIEGSESITYEDGILNATAPGEATVYVSTVWNGIESSLLTATIRVEAIQSVYITSYVQYEGSDETMIANEIDLSLVGEWCGKSYTTSANVSFQAEIDGEEMELTDVYVLEGADLIEYNPTEKTLLAKQNKRGVAKLAARYQSAGVEYVKALTVNVLCPMEEYSQLFELDASQNFPVDALFGSGAQIKEVYQGGVNITPAAGRKVLSKLVANGEETEDIEVYTTNGAYRFTNLYAYSKKLTQSNFVSTLSLSGKSSPISGFYVLGENVTVDMSSQIGGSTDVYFSGKFDGNGYTVNATVKDKGIFGHLGGCAKIFNTHFNFTFVNGANNYSAGLARNEKIHDMETLSKEDPSKRMYISLENLYITSTNYLAQSYTLMVEMPYFLSLTDIYVNINVGEATTGAGSNKAALFMSDRSLYNSIPAATHHLTGYNNVHVVTGAFVPMSDYCVPNSYGIFWAMTTYADNDVETIKAKRRSDAVNTEHMKLIPDPRGNAEEYGKYYTQDRYGAYTVYTYMGVNRYDTVAQLKAAGVSQIGSWTVA